MALIVEPDFEFAAHDVEELLAFVGIGFAAAATGFDPKEVRFHGGVAPSEKFHANVGAGFEHLALRRTNQRRSVAIDFEHREYVGLVEASDALESGDGRAHLATFESAEKSDGNVRGAGYLRERKSTLGAQATKALASGWANVSRHRDDTLFLKDVDNGGGVESTSTTKEQSALEHAHVRFLVHAVSTGSALRSDEAERLPRTQRGRRNAETASDFRNAEKPEIRQRIRWLGQILSA